MVAGAAWLWVRWAWCRRAPPRRAPDNRAPDNRTPDNRNPDNRNTHSHPTPSPPCRAPLRPSPRIRWPRRRPWTSWPKAQRGRCHCRRTEGARPGGAAILRHRPTSAQPRSVGRCWPTRWRQANAPSPPCPRSSCSTPAASPAAGGSAGGGQIVDSISRNLIELLWLDRSPAQTLAGGHVTTALAPRIQLEAGTACETLAPALRALGHEVVVKPTLSGAALIKRQGAGWVGAADP